MTASDESNQWAEVSLVANLDSDPNDEEEVKDKKDVDENLKRTPTAVGTYTILCLSYEKKKLAAACYEEHNHVVHYLREVNDDADFPTMQCLIERMRPTHVIANSSNNKAFRTALQLMLKCQVDANLSIPEQKMNEVRTSKSNTANSPLAERPTTDGEDVEDLNVSDVPVFAPSTSFDSTQNLDVVNAKPTKPVDEEDLGWFAPLQMLPRTCFSLEEGKKWLQDVLDYDERDSEMRMKFLFDCEETNMISAIGALLRHVNQLRIGVDVDDLNAISPVNSFKAIYLGDVLEVDRATVRALEIFEIDSTSRSKLKKPPGRRGKQRGSLFEICNLCKSTPGRHKLRSWFARPVTNRDILKQRLDGVSFFQQDCHAPFTQYIRSKLRFVNGLNGSLSRMRLSKIPVHDWINVLKTLQTLVDIGDGIRQYEVDLPILGSGAAALGNDLARLLVIVSESFNIEESSAEKRFIVSSGVSAELDELRGLLDELGTYLTDVAHAEIKAYGFASCSVCYLPIIGYMVVVPIDEQMHQDIERVYTSEDSVGYKTPAMHALDRRFGDIRSRIMDSEMLITNSLQELVLSRRKVLFEAIEIAATLDCLISLALVSRENNWNRPRFTNNSIINIQKAKHPIAEKACGDHFVDNPIQSGDLEFGESFKRVKLITGPNASGKSVYLKTVGVVLYLAHVGCFVPAARAEIGPINRIISRMYTIDMVLNGMSSFANDLKQMSDAIRKSDSNSVIIIDEFGKGTMTEVGLSLLASCLNYWLDNENRCPHVFVSTHFHSLRNLLHTSTLISDNLMKVIKGKDGELKFTYEFENGICEHSFANYTARKMGVDEAIVKRAEEVGQTLKKGKGLLDIEPKKLDEEVKMKETATKMESLYSDFTSWNLKENPTGFLEKVKSTFSST
ncbi:DNA-MISMATCH-REPAIR-2 domain-containing protein [Aphelenchoides besseyi]|nr:DNA-MISMATCH-REPAIR-2 domain-containing protein [Aphelenchoides besseyi]